MNEPLTPEKALDLLNQLRLKIEMTGQDHELARQAHETLVKFITQNAPSPPVFPET